MTEPPTASELDLALEHLAIRWQQYSPVWTGQLDIASAEQLEAAEHVLVQVRAVVEARARGPRKKPATAEAGRADSCR